MSSVSMSDRNVLMILLAIVCAMSCDFVMNGRDFHIDRSRFYCERSTFSG